MIRYIAANEKGFSAVELLVTLVIASMFLFAGYQLYTQVQRDGSEANRTAVISSKVTLKLQEAARSSAGTACVASGPTASAPEESGVGSVVYRTTVSCPNATIPTLKLILIEGEYGSNPVKKVSHATYTK